MMTVTEAARARPVMPQRSERRTNAIGHSAEFALIAGVVLAAIIAVGFAAFQFYLAI
ncbi:hypothetical protein [Martelella mediterranea]|uniref:Uncharacterized protein n=1 Tax=Martelella mediterranea DSM 17316 TaxID=1122214 RepID=A0A1U9YVK4_9HYPH|nr:hypothetical protein [Martelella mediterranea]AQZ49402.1 hypothetical protein Mame_00017 [Martelella mediterranea DSM 17316]